MRLSKYKHSGEVLDIASLTNKIPDELVCICCDSEVITRMGKINKHHFAHKSKNECLYSKKSMSDNSMSEFHIRLQDEYKSIGAELEVRMGNNIADCVLDNVVYEIQHSPISISEVKKRTDNYFNHSDIDTEPDIELVWIINEQTQSPTNFLYDNIVINYYDSSFCEIYYQGITHEYSIDSIEDLTFVKIKEWIEDISCLNIDESNYDKELVDISLFKDYSKRIYYTIHDGIDGLKNLGNSYNHYNEYREYKSLVKYYIDNKHYVNDEDSNLIKNLLEEGLFFFKYSIAKTCFPNSKSRLKNRTKLDLQLFYKLVKLNETGDVLYLFRHETNRKVTNNKIEYITKVETDNPKHRDKLISELSLEYMGSLVQYYLKTPSGYYNNLFYSYMKVNKLI